MHNRYEKIQNTKENLDSSGLDWRTIPFSHPERTIRIGTSFSGIGAIEHAFQRLCLKTEILFAGDIDGIRTFTSSMLSLFLTKLTYLSVEPLAKLSL